MVSSKVFGYGRYVFFYDYVEQNMVYVMEFNEKLKYELIEDGFTVEEFGEDICIAYKE